MKFFNLPRWIVWTLVSLLALLLCTVWQWKRAMNLLDTTAEKLEDALREKSEAQARAREAAAAAERERELSAKRAAISAEVKVELKKIDQDRSLLKQANDSKASDAKEEVVRSGTAVDKFNAWKRKRRP
jgi:F0F1-type ATP synthase membrane subunit b/b'